jgi:WD40 repeat protein
VSSHLKDEVTCQDFNERLSLVAMNTPKGVLQLWDFEQLRLVAATQQTTFALTCFAFTPCSPLLVQTSQDGCIVLYSVLRIKNTSSIRQLTKLIHLTLVHTNISPTATFVIKLNTDLFQTKLSPFSPPAFKHVSSFVLNGTSTRASTSKVQRKHLHQGRPKLLLILADEEGSIVWADLSEYVQMQQEAYSA